MPSLILQQRTHPRSRARESPRRAQHAAGPAELTGHFWTGAVADAYWLALSPSPVSPPPGLRGPFLRGMLTQFPDGQAPCGLP